MSRRTPKSTPKEGQARLSPPKQGSFTAVKQLRRKIARTKERRIKLPSGVTVVTEKDNETLHEEIHSLARQIMQGIEKGKIPSLTLPLRSSGNIIYDEENDLLLLGEKTTIRSLGSLRTLYHTSCMS